MIRRSAAVVSVLLLLLCSCGGPVAEVPIPDLAAAEPEVRERLARLHHEVGAAPRDGERWGSYGMALDAHGFVDAATSVYQEAHRLDPEDFRWPYFLAALYESSAPESALDWYRRALPLDPQYAPARVRIAQTLEMLGRDDEAWEQYQQASRLEPENPFGPLGLGRIALRRGEIEVAREHLENAYRLGSGIHAVVAALSQALYRTGESELAERRAAEARELPRITYQPDRLRGEIDRSAVDARSYLRRAAAYRDVGQLERALQEVKTGLELSPDLADAHFLASELHSRLGDHEAASRKARRGLELAPGRIGGRARLAKALHALGRYDDAEGEARQALLEDSDDAETRAVLASALARRGQLDEAIRHLEQALRTRPLEAPWRRMLAGILTDAGRLEEATAELRRVIDGAAAGDPALAEAWTDLGFVHLRRGLPRQAVDAFERAAAFEPTPRDTLPGLVQALTLTTGADDVRQRMQARLQERPGDHSARLLLADLLAESGRFASASEEIRRVLEAAPLRADAWVQLGYVRLFDRRPAEAVAAFEEALEHASEPALRSTAVQGLAQARAAENRAVTPSQ